MPDDTTLFRGRSTRLSNDRPACRQALVRAAGDGWLVTSRAGRFTWWRLTAAFEQFLDMGTEKIFGFTASQPDWDGHWLLVVTRAAETDRAGRRLLRTRLRWAGFGGLAPATWVSTHTDRRPLVEALFQSG